MSTNYKKVAQEIIFSNQYLTLGTTQPSGAVWVSPVAYAYDDSYNFYFISLPTSKHAINMMKSEKVVCAIFDSTQVFGEGVGLQIEGNVSKVPMSELPAVILLYLGRKWPFMNDKIKTYMTGFQKVLKNKSYTAYKISPTKVWMNNPDAEVDIRVEVQLT